MSEFPRVKYIVPAEMKIFHYNDNDDEKDKHTKKKKKKMVIGLNNQPVKPSAADQDVHFLACIPCFPSVQHHHFPLAQLIN